MSGLACVTSVWVANCGCTFTAPGRTVCCYPLFFVIQPRRYSGMVFFLGGVFVWMPICSCCFCCPPTLHSRAPDVDLLAPFFSGHPCLCCSWSVCVCNSAPLLTVPASHTSMWNVSLTFRSPPVRFRLLTRPLRSVQICNLPCAGFPGVCDLVMEALWRSVIGAASRNQWFGANRRIMCISRPHNIFQPLHRARTCRIYSDICFDRCCAPASTKTELIWRGGPHSLRSTEIGRNSKIKRTFSCSLLCTAMQISNCATRFMSLVSFLAIYCALMHVTLSVRNLLIVVWWQSCVMFAFNVVVAIYVSWSPPAPMLVIAGHGISPSEGWLCHRICLWVVAPQSQSWSRRLTILFWQLFGSINRPVMLRYNAANFSTPRVSLGCVFPFQTVVVPSMLQCCVMILALWWCVFSLACLHTPRC